MNLIVWLFAFFAFLPLSRAAESIKADHVEISWLAPKTAGRNAENFAIHFKIDEHWHVYWKNPGDSGSAPKFQFSGNAEVGEIKWPIPTRIPVAHLVNIGYDKEVAFPFEVKSQGDKLHLEAKLEWLVCQEECIPGFATLTLDRPVAEKAEWADRAILAKYEARLPQKSSDSNWKITGASATQRELRLKLDGSGPIPEVFPYDANSILPRAPTQAPRAGGADLVFSLIEGKTAPATSSFLLVDQGRAFDFVDVSTTSSAAPEGVKTAALDFASLALLLLSAFAGGLILNLMPCVLPVLSIKFLSLTKAHPESRAKESLLYTAGVLITFLALGGMFLLLRSAGAAVGWGFQLQSPIVVLALVVLFFLMALNFLGVFEFGTSVMNAAGRSTSSGSFATGVLSVFVAAPCTGPFMGSALGAAAVVPAAQALALFFFLGLGLASPFLLFAMNPRFARVLPKPGAWMDRLKQFFAFPLLATVLWLLWVLGLQTGNDGWLIGGSLLLALAFALWLGSGRSKRARIVAWVFAAACLILAGDRISRASAPKPAASAGWVAYDPAKLVAARAAKQPVFVDFTAAWCISCQVNKKTVLETAPIETYFREKGVVLLRADWTNQDPVVTKALEDLGRNSIPVYAYYPADGSAVQILPQVLTPAMITNLIPN